VPPRVLFIARTHAGSQWINPERPFVFSLPLGAQVVPDDSFILEITSSWSVNGNTSTEFTEFPRIFPTTPLGKPGDPRKPTIEVSSPVVRPNPSNPTASIQYELPAGMRVTLEIFDVKRASRTKTDHGRSTDQRTARRGMEWPQQFGRRGKLRRLLLPAASGGIPSPARKLVVLR